MLELRTAAQPIKSRVMRNRYNRGGGGGEYTSLNSNTTMDQVLIAKDISGQGAKDHLTILQNIIRNWIMFICI